MGNYYQPEIETMPVEKLQALQSERLVEQVKYVYDHVESKIFINFLSLQKMI